VKVKLCSWPYDVRPGRERDVKIPKEIRDYKHGIRNGSRLANVSGIRTKSFWKGYRDAFCKKMLAILTDPDDAHRATIEKRMKRMTRLYKKQTSDGRTYWTLK